MQTDANFVIYRINPRSVIWASNTVSNGQPPHMLVMQNDGNLVIYNYNGVTWTSGTANQGAKPHRLVMQDNGDLVIYDRNGYKTWTTGTKPSLS